MKWKVCLEEFENFLKFERNLSDNTVSNYIYDLKKLNNFLKQNKIAVEPSNINVDIIREFLYHESKKIKSRTQGRLISSLNTFFGFLVIENKIISNPIKKVSYPKNKYIIPEILSLEEIDKIILQASLNSTNGERNKAIFELMYSCGLRVSELINLKISNLFFKESLIKVLGKGNKYRFVPISKIARELVLFYIENIRCNVKIKKGYDDSLFLNNRGMKLSRVMVFLILKKITRELGIKKNISPHTFRHSFATHMIQNGADIISIQKMMGHENITTTEKYLNVDKKHLFKTLIKFHPRK
tara:strand:- start:2989 stop:3885 length:897 start_codon:yes stop_codon:yes gene_type:complete